LVSYFFNIGKKKLDEKHFVFGLDYIKKMRRSAHFVKNQIKEAESKITIFASTRRVQTLNSVLFNKYQIKNKNKKNKLYDCRFK